MKNIVFGFILIVLMASCKVNKKPEFIKVNDIKIVDKSFKNFTIEAVLLFKNENDVGGSLQARDLHVFVDSMDVATINSKLFKIPKRQEFEMPLQAVIPFEKIFNDNKQNLLNSIMNVIATKHINVKYKGVVRYKLGAFKYDYEVDKIQEISFKK